LNCEFHESEYVTFSGRQNEENELKGYPVYLWDSRLGRSRVFRPPAAENERKGAYVTLSCGFQDSPEVAFLGSQNSGNELIRNFIPLNYGFHKSEEFAFADRKNAGKELKEA
jgi:hypothetical protein